MHTIINLEYIVRNETYAGAILDAILSVDLVIGNEIDVILML